MNFVPVPAASRREEAVIGQKHLKLEKESKNNEQSRRGVTQMLIFTGRFKKMVISVYEKVLLSPKGFFFCSFRGGFNRGGLKNPFNRLHHEKRG